MKTKWLKSATAAALCLSIGMTGRARVIADDLSAGQQKIYYAVFFKEADSANAPEGTGTAAQDASADAQNIEETDAQSTTENEQSQPSDGGQEDNDKDQQTDDQQADVDQQEAGQDGQQTAAVQQDEKPAGVTLEKDRQNGITYSVVLMKAAGELPAKVQGVDGTEVEISSDVRSRILEGEVYLETYDNHLYCAEDNRMVNPVTGEEEAAVNGFLPIELDNPADASAFAVAETGEDGSSAAGTDGKSAATAENGSSAAGTDGKSAATAESSSSAAANGKPTAPAGDSNSEAANTTVTGSAVDTNPAAAQNAGKTAESATKTETANAGQTSSEAADIPKTEPGESVPSGDTAPVSTDQSALENTASDEKASASAEGAEKATASASEKEKATASTDEAGQTSASASETEKTSASTDEAEQASASAVSSENTAAPAASESDWNAAGDSEADPAAGKAEQKVIVVEDTAAEDTEKNEGPDDSNAVILERGHLSDGEYRAKSDAQKTLTLDEAMETFMPTQRKAVIADTIVNIREEASEEAKTVGTLVTGGVAYVEYQNAEWVYLESGDIRGFAKKSDFLPDAVGKAYMSDMVQDKAGSRIGFAREGGGYSLPKAAATVDPSENAALFFRQPDTASSADDMPGYADTASSADGMPRYADTGILISNVEKAAAETAQEQTNGQEQSAADALPQLLSSEGTSAVRVGGIYTYERWDTNWNAGTRQRWLYENYENYDAEGFGRIGDRYVIACTTTFGNVGDMVDFVLENGTVIKAVIGDAKNQNDPGCTKWGHLNGKNVIEFIVDGRSWYTGHVNPGTSACHPEWGGLAVVKAVNYGSLDA